MAALPLSPGLVQLKIILWFPPDFVWRLSP